MNRHRSIRVNITSHFQAQLAKDLFLLREHNISVPPHEPFPRYQSLPPTQRNYWKQRNHLYRGMYALQLAEWMKHYTLGDNLLVLQYERFRQAPQQVLNDICDFVGIPQHLFDRDHFTKTYVLPGVNANATSIDIVVDNATHAYLQQLYRPYNDQLADLLGESWRGVWDDAH
jgi:hypothetical protein